MRSWNAIPPSGSFPSSAGPSVTTSPAFAQGCISAVWSCQAITLILLGLIGNLRYRRILGITIFGVVLGKVFLLDMSQIEAVYRILSFVACGILLLAASYLYHNYGKRLCQPAEKLS